MAPMKSSREMAVASRVSETNRKRLASDSELDDDNDSGSDFGNTKTTKKRPRAKKPRVSMMDSPKTNNASSTGALQTLKLPKVMACPDGVTPFSKPHWTALAKTDEFWAYFDKMVGPHLTKRLALNINLNADEQKKREAKEAREAAKASLRPSAIKSGPVYHSFDDDPSPSRETTNPPSTVNSGVAAVSTNVISAERMKELMMEQEKVLAACKANKIMEDDRSGKKDTELGGLERDEPGNRELTDPTTATEINKDGQAGTVTSAAVENPKAVDDEQGRWEPKGW